MRVVWWRTASCLALFLLLKLCPTSATAAEPTVSLSATDLNNQGVRAAEEGRFEVGVELLRKAVQVDPQDALARKNLSGILTDWANLLDQANQATQAEQALQEAVALEPDNGPALARLGDLAYFTHSDFDRAIALWKRAHSTFEGVARRALADRISQAQRDQTIERNFTSHRTAHFSIRVPGRTEVELDRLGPLLETAWGLTPLIL